MRQVLFLFAILGALFSGWLPAMAATLSVGQPAGVHAMHDMNGKDGGGDHGKTKPMAHPVACSACFAIEAERIEPAGRLLVLSEHTPALPPALAGLALRPLNPPPRA
ncbi:hypothetical protein GB928_014285 [Shinella curvata]|uniref:DUF2946 family protein n=1 Tax=Shinella curvata TaxID=1817964 RepID=A0ABT8XFF0_9HYPH|nr:hypothetical protein [Shinella curvata]MCJ8053026.1 hypothetical protein [Shinella curvata]MDO6122357.1 hypothetical protein [Shinella curvata]